MASHQPKVCLAKVAHLVTSPTHRFPAHLNTLLCALQHFPLLFYTCSAQDSQTLPAFSSTDLFRSHIGHHNELDIIPDACGFPIGLAKLAALPDERRTAGPDETLAPESQQYNETMTEGHETTDFKEGHTTRPDGYHPTGPDNCHTPPSKADCTAMLDIRYLPNHVSQLSPQRNVDAYSLRTK